MRDDRLFVKGVLGVALGAVLSCMATGALAQSEIKIGEINSYSLLPSFTEPYRKGWQLAVEEINAAGGVDGKKIVVISKDDAGKPAEAQTAANELVSKDGVVMLTGTFLSNIGLAVADFAGHNKTFFLASEPLTDKIVWADGNPYTYRLRSSTYMQVAMLIPAAVKMHKQRWALVYPNYEYGQSAAATFKRLLKQAQPDVQFVAEQAARAPVRLDDSEQHPERRRLAGPVQSQYAVNGAFRDGDVDAPDGGLALERLEKPPRLDRQTVHLRSCNPHAK